MPAASALAHFGMLIPSTELVESPTEANAELMLAFAHPMDGTGMNFDRPSAFYVVVNGIKEDLSATLKPTQVYGHEAWNAAYLFKKPGLYQFVMEPKPYWEAAEDRYIVHCTKTFVSVFGEEEGWDQALGLKTEIVPLTRPFGNYAGNLFQGQVLIDGKPAPGVTVEVEFFNRRQEYKAPYAALTTQVVKTDGNGVFSYAVPFAGWWGFAALSTSPDKISFGGEPKTVELGAVLWAHFVGPKRN